MIKQSGMVLLTTILMLALLTLLVLSQMQMVLLYYKALNQVVEKHQSFYQLEAEANRLALNDSWSMQQTCVTNEKNPNDIIELLKNKQGCVLTHDKQQFFYLIEELGLFPCLQTRLGQVIYSTQHWRINIITIGKYPAFLQLRIARLAKVAACENSEPTQIKVGLLSWRHLSGEF